MVAVESLGEEDILVTQAGDHLSIRHLEAGLHRVGQAALDAFPDPDPIHDDEDVMPEGLVQHGGLPQLQDLAVHQEAGEAPADHLGEEVAVLAFTVGDERGHEEDVRTLVQSLQAPDHLLRCLLPHRAAALVAALVAHPREEDPQVVQDLSDGANGGARVAGRCLLLDRHCRRQPRDPLEPGPFNLSEELPGISGQGLHVAPLTLREDGVEGQAALSRPAHPGEHDQRVLGQRQIHSAQVVLRSPDDLDLS